MMMMMNAWTRVPAASVDSDLRTGQLPLVWAVQCGTASQSAAAFETVSR